MTVAVAGATGFTGRRVAARLAARGLPLRCLVRSTSDVGVLPAGAETINGDVGDRVAIGKWMRGCDSLVYCASMGFGHIDAVVSTAQTAGIKRAVFISTTAIFTRLNAQSRTVRIAAESSVRTSRLAWTIIRPTMIFGAPGDRNMERLLRQIFRFRVVVIPGNGKALIQPVHVDDLADAVVTAFATPAAERKVYDVSGKAPLSLNDVIDAASKALGARCLKIHLPLAPVAKTLGAIERTPLRRILPVKSEQVLRLAEDKAFPHHAAARDLAFEPGPFEDDIAVEAWLLGLSHGVPQ